MGNVLRSVALASALVTTAGCAAAETYGSGSVLTPERGCQPIETTVELNERGDWVAYGVDDLTTNDDIVATPKAAIDDQLRITAVGVAGTTAVTEVVFEGDTDMVIEDVQGLPWDRSFQSDDETRVDVADIVDAEDGFSFEVREADRKTTVSLEALDDGADGVAVTFDQDCEVLAEVAE